MYKEYNFHRFFITDKSHRYITWTLNVDNFLGRSVEFYNIFLLTANSNTLLLLKDLFGLLKKSGSIIINTGTKYRNRTTLRPR